MKNEFPSDIIVSGPYYRSSCPYGTFTTLHRREWYINRNLSPKKRKTPIEKILGTTCLGCIIKFDNRRDYAINQLYPRTAFPSLKKAIQFLITNEGKLVFCT